MTHEEAELLSDEEYAAEAESQARAYNTRKAYEREQTEMAHFRRLGLTDAECRATIAKRHPDW